MRFYPLFLLYFTLTEAYQQAFFSQNTPSDTVSLKSVYHRGSETGPIPHLFRKHYVDVSIQSTFAVDGVTGRIDRPAHVDRAFLASSQRPRWHGERPMHLESAMAFLPNVKDRASVHAMALMASNAYVDIGVNDTDWYDLGAPWSLNQSFGWASDGIRGHVFSNKNKSLVVVSIKGTSAGLFTGGPTGDKDKINDNMLFSCCCARISRAWTPVCDCYQGNDYRCESKCLERSIQETELYYDLAYDIVTDVLDSNPNSTVWLTGHSLGGALASLVGQTLGLPTVTFESPGEAMASKRLHLPAGPGIDLPVWHFGHTADPIFVGVCNGVSSSCWYGGFAMESRCHSSKVCVWNTVNDNGWRVDIRSHRIRDVIEDIFEKPDEFPLPDCAPERDCQDCGLWDYFDDRDPELPTDPSKFL